MSSTTMPSSLTFGQKIKITVLIGLVTAAIFNPWTYQKTDALAESVGLGRNILASISGTPTTMGIFVHAAVAAGLGFAGMTLYNLGKTVDDHL